MKCLGFMNRGLYGSVVREWDALIKQQIGRPASKRSTKYIGTWKVTDHRL